MLKREFDFYTRLKEQQTISKSNIPKTILESDSFKTLKRAGTIVEKSSGRGYKYSIEKKTEFINFYNNRYPNSHIETITEQDNQLKYRDTKATKLEKDRVILIRGFEQIEINNKLVDLADITEKFTLFSTVLDNLNANKICFVENLQPFLEAEKVIGKDYIFIHFYGRFPKNNILEKIICKEYLHFSDYDFVGLHEYLRAKEVYKNAKLFIPDNYDKLFKKYSKPRKEGDTIYQNIKRSNQKEIVKIREEIKNCNRFLEQQVVMELL